MYDHKNSTSQISEPATDQELIELFSKLFDMIQENPADFDIDFQGQVSQGSQTDRAPQK